MVAPPAEQWTILSEETAFAADPWLRVTRQRVRTDQGVEVDDYYQVQLPDFAIACALTTAGEVITLWQYKHGARAYGLTFPAGVIEPGENPEAAMRRELLEETGYRAGPAQFLGRYVCTSNQGAGWAHIFVLTGCERVADCDSGDLEAMDLRLLSPGAVDAELGKGSINGLPHLATWTTARHLYAAEFAASPLR